MTDDFAAQAREVILRLTNNSLIDRGGDQVRWNNITKLMDEALAALLALHRAELERAEAALLDKVETEVINTSKEIYMKNDLLNLLETQEYVKIREELRTEQRQRLSALRGGRQA